MSKSIFIVDDQKPNYDYMEAVLSGDGYFLQYLNSGKETLEYLRLLIPDLILLDVQMPEMDGIELLKKIKEIPVCKFIPIIMVTGLNTKEDLALCLGEGADDFITKPFSALELKARIRSMLRVKEQYDQLNELRSMQEKLLRLLQGELSFEKENKELILDSLNEAVIITDKNGIITYANIFNVNFFDRERNSIIGKPLDSIAKFMVNDKFIENPFNYLVNNSGKTIKIINSSNQESFIEFSYYLSKSKKDIDNSFIFVFKDITKKQEMDKIISYQATHDILTGLLNRVEFDIRLQKAVSDTIFSNNEHILLYLDLDQFKFVNDSCGHMAGDQLLKQVAVKLENCLNKSDCIFRIGGDEFTVILENTEIDYALALSKNIIAELNKEPFTWESNSFEIGTSIGIVSINKETASSSAAQILSFADNACFVAKHNGRNKSHIFTFDDTFLTKQREEIIWLQKIKFALENNKFCLFFQEVRAVKNNNNERSGEILIRMAEGGKIISPYLFIPVAEQFNKMVEIDQWVVENTFSFISSNIDKLKNILFKINLSGHSLGSEDFTNFVVNCFAKHKIDYSNICFEITETVAISNLSSGLKFINFFKSKGCKFSLDDFGSGLSSFGYLKNLPVDYVKIDGSFVRDINKDNYCLNMVEAINNISHSMNLKTIAEFVENEDIFNKLAEIKIDYVQGYYIAKPAPLEDLIK
jgi:diguanylate cyclase (GGDEF)-like protein